jgi:hypothetical protein
MSPDEHDKPSRGIKPLDLFMALLVVAMLGAFVLSIYVPKWRAAQPAAPPNAAVPAPP